MLILIILILINTYPRNPRVIKPFISKPENLEDLIWVNMSLMNFKHIELNKCFLEHGFKFWIVTGHFVAHRKNRQFSFKRNWLFLLKVGLPYSVATLTTTCVILDLFWPLICCYLLVPSYLVAQWPKNCINLNESLGCTVHVLNSAIRTHSQLYCTLITVLAENKKSIPRP